MAHLFHPFFLPLLFSSFLREIEQRCAKRKEKVSRQKKAFLPASSLISPAGDLCLQEDESESLDDLERELPEQRVGAGLQLLLDHQLQKLGRVVDQVLALALLEDGCQGLEGKLFVMFLFGYAN